MALTPEQAQANTKTDLRAVITAAQTALDILEGTDSFGSDDETGAIRREELATIAKQGEATFCRMRRNLQRGLLFFQ